MALYLPLFQALNNSGTRHVVVDGLAAVLRGYSRLTADVDIVVDLDPPAVTNVLQALEKLGLRPRLVVYCRYLCSLPDRLRQALRR